MLPLEREKRCRKREIVEIKGNGGRIAGIIFETFFTQIAIDLLKLISNKHFIRLSLFIDINSSFVLQIQQQCARILDSGLDLSQKRHRLSAVD